MTEIEKAVAAKLLAKIAEAADGTQLYQIEKYHNFLRAVETRKSIENADRNPWTNMTATGIAAQQAA